jgi:hypothetical protein
MLNKFSKLILFYFAFLPLFILIFIKNGPENIFLQIGVIISLILTGILTTGKLLDLIHTIVPSETEFIILKQDNKEYLVFLMTYILPLLIDITAIKDLIVLLIILILIYYFYVTSSIFCINPLLKIIFKYNLYEIEINKKNVVLISKKNYMEKKITSKIIKLSNNIYIEN